MTPWSRFGQGSVEITISDTNMFDEQTVTQSHYVAGNNLETQGLVYPSTASNTSNYISLKKDETVTITYKYNELLSGGIRGYAFYDKDKKVIRKNKDLLYDVTNRKLVITAEEDCYFRFTYDKNCYDIRVAKNVQIKVMPIQKPFLAEATFEQKEDGWYEKHARVLITLTGDEFFSDIYNTNPANPYQTWALAIQNVASTWSSMYGITCTHLTRILGNDAMNKNKIGICSDNNNLLFCVPFLTAEEFKNWLKEQYNVGIPLRVVCRLKNTEYIKCTDEQSKILDKIDTYRDGTIITTDNDLCKISLRYKQDLESRIIALEKQILNGGN